MASPSNDISAISAIPGLFVSSRDAVLNTETLEHHGITHVISLMSPKYRPSLAPEIVHLQISIEDNPYENLMPCFAGLSIWMDNALQPKAISSGQGGGVLICCVQGISRSGAIAISCVMRRLSLGRDDALGTIRRTRPIVDPNSGFMDQLSLWHALQYRIYEFPSAKTMEEMPMKQKYLDWTDERGILMSKAETERIDSIEKRMRSIVWEEHVVGAQIDVQKS